MKNTLPKTILMAALAVGGGAAFAPDAEARHKRGLDHRSAPSSYACMENTTGFHVYMQVHYKRKYSNKWEQAPWSHPAPPKKTTCMALGLADEWREFHVYAKVWGGTARPAFCYRATRGVANRDDQNYPRYAVGKFTARWNWKTFSTRVNCKFNPRITNSCPGCKHKEW